MKKIGIVLLTFILTSVVSIAQQRNFDPEDFAKRQTAQLKEGIRPGMSIFYPLGKIPNLPRKN